ncbi:DUF4275 family protein [Paenibacillus lemnae]|uniref:DUF4275 family protein n=2 Tax=Paenibacillus lemnae TaxID=1330551 RepID=A0A848M8Q6_PAELE|nr:DUF4275 family protein [Paenibacillus lemnae]
MVRNHINKMLDELPEKELSPIFWAVREIYDRFQFQIRFQEKGVVVSEMESRSQALIEQWDRSFTAQISEEVKSAIHYEQYKWHIFSFEIQECLQGNAAREAFDHIPKDDVYVMYQNKPNVQLYKNAQHILAEDFDTEQDIYIFDQSFKWTYIHTHEDMCGPYFYQAGNKRTGRDGEEG